MLQKQTNDIFRESIHKLFRFHESIETPIEDDYSIRVADCCHVLQSLIFILLDDMGEIQTDGMPVQFIILFGLDISA